MTDTSASEGDGYMRVKELRALLAEFADDLLVVLQKDAEGNGFSPLAGGEGALYVPDSTWSGEVPHPDDVDDYLHAEGAESCVCLWPVN